MATLALAALKKLGGFLLPYIIKGALIAVVVGAIWNAGYRSAKHKCQIAAKNATIAAGRIDNAAGADAATQVDKANQEVAADAVNAEREVPKYAEHLKSKPDRRCTLDADDVRWLREPDADNAGGSRKR